MGGNSARMSSVGTIASVWFGQTGGEGERGNERERERSDILPRCVRRRETRARLYTQRKRLENE